MAVAHVAIDEMIFDWFADRVAAIAILWTGINAERTVAFNAQVER